MAPVALGIEVPEVEAVGQAQLNLRHGTGNFPRDEGLAAQRAFVVEQDAVGGVHPVGFAVVFDNPESVQFRDAVGAARIKGRGFALGRFLHQTVQL